MFKGSLCRLAISAGLQGARFVRVGRRRWIFGGSRWRRAERSDERGRVLVPLGVRRTLGLDQTVVVSVSDGRVVIWPTAALDALLEVAP